MTYQKNIAFWLLMLLIFGFMLYEIRAVVMPFAAGLVIAYLLDPLATKLEKEGISRLFSSILILGIFSLIVTIALIFAIPTAMHQMTGLIENLPQYGEKLQRLLMEKGSPIIERFMGQDVLVEFQKSIGSVAGQGATWLGSIVQSIWAGGRALISIVSLPVITPVVAFYLLMDWHRMVRTVDSWLPVAHRETIRRLAREIDRAIAGFLRGQSLVCLILGIFYAFSLSFLGLNYGALIGAMSGLFTFIPYVGTLSGLIVALALAFVQFSPDWLSIGLVASVFIIGNIVEGNFLSPKLVGGAVGLHPVWLMFALLACGSLFGFSGLLIAVPLAAIIGVLMRYFLSVYMKGRFYDPDLIPIEDNLIVPKSITSPPPLIEP